MMRTLVIGFGSIGERHARVLTELGHAVAVVSRRATVTASTVFRSVAEALKQWTPEYVVVANETSAHAESLRALAVCGFRGKVLVEKPVVSNLAEAEALGALPFQKVWVGYNLRFHPALRLIGAWLPADSKLLMFSAHCGQYLPSWRPNSDYRASYSADGQRGGGVLRDLSHEIDYTQWLAGPIDSLAASGGKKSELAINSDDVFDVLGSSSRCSNINLHVNYLHRVHQRRVIVTTDRDSIVADLITGEVRSHLHGGATVKAERDSTYRSMHVAATGDAEGLCTWSEGVSVLRVIDAAERAAASRCWIAVR